MLYVDSFVITLCLSLVQNMITQKQTIFNEEDLKKLEEELPSLEEKGKSLPISQDEYKQVVKEAYKEGVKEAIKEVIKNKAENEKILGEEEGKKEQAKETAKVEQIAEEKMEALSQKKDIVLFQANSYFPFDPFPDTIVIDTSKVSIIHREFLASEEVITMLLKEITDVSLESSLFLANLKFSYAHNPIKPLSTYIYKLKRADAITAKDILEGILVVHREGVDLSKISPETIVTFVKNLGRSKNQKADSPKAV